MVTYYKSHLKSILQKQHLLMQNMANLEDGVNSYQKTALDSIRYNVKNINGQKWKTNVSFPLTNKCDGAVLLD